MQGPSLFFKSSLLLYFTFGMLPELTKYGEDVNNFGILSCGVEKSNDENALGIIYIPAFSEKG